MLESITKIASSLNIQDILLINISSGFITLKIFEKKDNIVRSTINLHINYFLCNEIKHKPKVERCPNLHEKSLKANLYKATESFTKGDKKMTRNSVYFFSSHNETVELFTNLRVSRLLQYVLNRQI